VETVVDIKKGGNGTKINIDLSQKGSENKFVVAHEVGHGVDIDNGVDTPIEISNVAIPLRQTYTLEVQYISPFSSSADVKNKTINVKNESYDYYKKK
jgi:hypothetical protein